MLRRKRNQVAPRHAAATERIKKLSTHSLFEWAEQCLYVYGKCMHDAQETTDIEHMFDLLKEAQVAALIANEIALDLTHRYQVDKIRPA